MRRLVGLAARFFNDKGGATAIEYAIIAGSLSIVIVVVVSSLGTTIAGVFTSVNTGLSAFK